MSLCESLGEIGKTVDTKKVHVLRQEVTFEEFLGALLGVKACHPMAGVLAVPAGGEPRPSRHLPFRTSRVQAAGRSYRISLDSRAVLTKE